MSDIEVVKESGRYFRKTDRGLVLIDYEDVLTEWIERNTPPAASTNDIAEDLNMSYHTLHPKLKRMYEEGKIDVKKRKETAGPGRRKYLWLSK